MTEHENDGHYWVPDKTFPLRQGDLLVNVPVSVLPDPPEFVLRHPGGRSADLDQRTENPDVWPTDEVVLQVRWGAMSLVITPTCHVSDDEKDSPLVAVVPVEPLAMVVPDNSERDKIRNGGKTPLHLFHLPATELAGELLRIDHVAQLDRPGTFPKENLRSYRRLGLYLDYRFKLRSELAWFWARAEAANWDKQLAGLKDSGRALEELE